MKWLNDSRARSVLAGGLGGFLGWRLAELIFGAPQSFLATIGFGILAGIGIGACLGAAEGLFLQAWGRARQGALIGLLVGMAGGCVGSVLGQAGFAATTRTPGSGAATQSTSVFSAEMQKRLTEAGAKSGEVEIALIWQNTADLDLHVVDPGNELIFFGHKFARSGGELDVDRNAGCNLATNSPVEHVVWPTGRAPTGDFEVLVHHYARCGVSGPVPYTVEILVDGKRQTLSGTAQPGTAPQRVSHFVRGSGESRDAPTPASPSILGGAARVFGWLIFGALLGCSEGFRRKSGTALRNAAIGGAIGGAVGGLVFEIIARLLIPLGLSDAWCRGFGLIILGACIGLWIVIVERALTAVLAVRSGRFEGREIFLDKREMRLGRNDILEIYLGYDAEVAPHHATLRQEGNQHVLVKEGGAVLVNSSAIDRRALADGDSIEIGKTRLVYRSHNGSPIPSAASPFLTSSAVVQAPPPPPTRKPRATTSPESDPAAPKAALPTTDAAPPGGKTEAGGMQIPPPPPPPKQRS